MVWSSGFALAAAAFQFSKLVSADPTWPCSYDELEDIMVLNQGYKAKQLSLPVTPCGFSRVPGFLPSAGFLRTAFHDVGTHNAAEGTGGLDASIIYELTGPGGKDNAGPFANNTLTFLSRYYSQKVSMSDMIALATYTAVRSCGGPIIPIRTGRKDATEAGPVGLPKVDATQQTHIDTFRRMGFTTEEMIKLVACGHTLGGVHPPQFPQVAAGRTDPVLRFDHTPDVFDNGEVVDFVRNDTINPLVKGPPQSDADLKVFTSDGGATMRQLANADVFQSECQVMLQKMLDTVPAGVQLTEAIEVYDVKPGSINLEISADGKSLEFSGEIRVRTTDRPQSAIASVTIVYVDHNGKTSESVSTKIVGTASGYDDAFTFFAFDVKVDATSGIDSFIVIITGTDGSAKTYDNNGQKYAVDDSVFVQHSGCSVGKPDASGNIVVEIVAAARGSVSDVYLTTHLQIPRDVPVPLLSTSQAPCTKDSSAGEYNFYKSQFTIKAQQINSTTFDVGCNLGGKSHEAGFNRLFGIKGSQNIGGGPDNDVDDDDDNSSNGGHGSGRPCGEDEACDAQGWAHKTQWAVPTPAYDEHTVPGGWGQGSKPSSVAAADNGNVGSGKGGWSGPTSAPVAPATGSGNFVPKPTAPVDDSHPVVGVYKGAAASHDSMSSATLVSIIAALAFGMAVL